MRRLSPERAGWAVAGAAVLLAVPACTGSTPAPNVATSQSGPTTTSSSQAGPATPQVVSRIDAGLAVPWSIVFLPDGTALISERDSALLRFIPPGATGPAGTVGKVPGVVPGGEGGLLGLALSPDFATDRYLYAYFTAQGDNRIARFKVDDNGGRLALGVPETIFTGIPKASTHNGGRIRFGPDGNLYVGTGDSQRREQPQDKNALGGKILRLTPEGAPAAGNPFGNSPVYSLGHRNVQGLDWDGAGRLWASEFGPDKDDELNLIVPGGNYGWPEVTGAPHRDGFLDAKVVWPSTADSSPSGLEIAGDTAYLGALRGQRLWSVPLKGDFAADPVAYFTGQFGRIRDVARAPDGQLWALSNGQNPDFAVVLSVPQ
ncbi:sorbosone dehydrogenase family protein [Arthrobacter sp. B3I4]|uniref:PQQ-dependent sugar dehydrogenase n=1 Tax=Arthrobacter sp. B3I4 TaxID=3042267 RepID=UPI00278320D1|nr:PQQ-dependent sugar dehydrogenase [Arthrobacter sp. B3I4]MDQ0755959.1 glucose/arabinose dehydrogenase [Arthrobacter sp. B3I4]